MGLGCSPFQLFRVAWVWESDAASRGVCIGWPEPGASLYCLFADLLLTPLAMHLTGACHWPRPSDCKTDANSSISGKRTPRVICIVYGVCVWSYLRGAEETDPHSPLRACGRNVWVGGWVSFSSLFFFFSSCGSNGSNCSRAEALPMVWFQLVRIPKIICSAVWWIQVCVCARATRQHSDVLALSALSLS